MECNSTTIEDFNFTIYEYPGYIPDSLVLTWREYLKIFFYVVAIIVALIGNIMVIVTVLSNRSMRTTINCYLVNLALADLLICACCMWVHLVNNIYPLYILGPFFCKFNSFAQMCCLAASVLTLTAISFDRLIAILWPLHVRITKQRTSAVISVIWVVSMIVSIPFIIYRKYYEIQWRDYVETNCQESWPQVAQYDPKSELCVGTYPAKKIYYTLVTVTLFFLPVAVMSTAYALIIWRLWVSKLPGEANEANMVVQNRAKKTVIKMVCLVMVVFVICWMPLQLIVLYSIYVHSSGESGELPEWFSGMTYFATFIAYSNSSLNPIIYGGFNKNFRKNMCFALKCNCASNNRRMSRPYYSTRSHNTVTSAVNGSPLSCGRTRSSIARYAFDSKPGMDVNSIKLQTSVLDRSIM